MMLRVYALHADGRAESFQSPEHLRHVWLEANSRLWVDVERPDEADLNELGDIFNLRPESLDDALRGEQRPRIDDFSDHLFLLQYAAMGVEDPPVFAPQKLAIFFGERFLISVHEQPLRSTVALHRRCDRNGGQVLTRGTDYVLYILIDSVVDNYLLMADHLEDRIAELEDKSLDPNVGYEILEDLSDLRRDLLGLRRIASAQREVLIPAARGELEDVSEQLEFRFGHVIDHFTSVLETIDGMRELLNGIKDNYHTALTNRMNNIMKTLTIFASVLLPLTLITGVYGMNLALWPGPEDPRAFWSILALMSVLGSGLLIYFRLRKWL